MSVSPEVLKALEAAHKAAGMAVSGTDPEFIAYIVGPWDTNDRHPWRYFVPGLLWQGRWDSLSDDAKVTAYIIGVIAASEASETKLDELDEFFHG
ncbi:MAG: hypothetical protein K8T91_22575 [Planctomycetes bacterium]|nr:hypothetical protein [Planctomycetota bacterium]